MGHAPAIIVVGASAGGMEAVRSLAAALPADFPAALFVVLHIGAHKSELPSLLNQSGPLRAVHPESADPIRPGRIYVAPPDRHLLVEPGHPVVFSSDNPASERFLYGRYHGLEPGGVWTHERNNFVVFDVDPDIAAAGAVVTEGMQIPPGSLAAGVPAKVRKELDEDALEALRQNARTYVELALKHRAATAG